MISEQLSMQEVLKKSSGKKAVFFDFFDTLVTRTVHPEHVKRLWARDLSLILDMSETTEELYGIRAEVESAQCQENSKEGADLEFKFNEMVQEVFKRSSVNKSVSEQKFLELATSLELNHEKVTQTPIKQNFELLQELSKNKDVFIVSDFYFPASFIWELCDFHGFSPYLKNIFTSSDYLLTKRSGRLFQEVLDNLGVEASEVVMLGDNSHSDVSMPASLGIAAIHLEADHTPYQKHWDRSTPKCGLNTFLQPHQSANWNPFSWLGSTFFLFIRRLHASLIRDGHKDVFFLAREGEFLKTLFDVYQSQFVKETALQIRSNYLMVSRRSTYLPSLKAIGEENFERLFSQYRFMSTATFLKSINIDRAELESSYEFQKFDFNIEYEDFPTSDAFYFLKSSKTFETVYERQRLKQKAGLMAHLQKLEPLDYNAIAIVDVGWKGSIQDNLSLAFPNTVFHGYYLGLVEGVPYERKNPKNPLVFRVSLGERKPTNIFNENRALFETMLAASHGSTQKYELNGLAVTEEKQAEQDQFFSLFRHIQGNVLSVFRNFCLDLEHHWVDDDVMLEAEVKHYMRHILLPSKQELDIFEGLVHYENFGFFNYTKFDSQESLISLKSRLKNLFLFVKRPRSILMTAWWKPLAFRQMGLSPLKYLYFAYKSFTLTSKD